MTTPLQSDKNDRREVFGWTMYDWANSAFSTTVITVLAGPYLTSLAQADVGANGRVLSLGPFGAVTALSLFPFCISFSVVLQVLFLPFVGAIADYTRHKKRMMAILCYLGVAGTSALFFVTGDLYVLGGVLLVFANVCFGASIVVYNALLNDITSDEERDRVSSRGFALGYLGGGLLLAVNLGMITAADALGLTRALAVRLAFLSAGLWWGGFAILTFVLVRTRAPLRVLPEGHSAVANAFSELAATWRALRRLPLTFRYLVSYTLYNDGIHTVISIASLFLAQELFVSRGLAVDESFLIGVILMVQFVAFAGAIVFERIAALAGARRGIILSLVIWTGVVAYAYAVLQTTAQAWFMAAIIALVLGGSQALSRSLFSRMIPAGYEASFFGLYEISDRGTSWIGPLLFGVVAGSTGSYRNAILSLVVLFLAGLIVLLCTNTDRAILVAGTVGSPTSGSNGPHPGLARAGAGR
jgi:UMF1 family MFS transporter